MANKDGTILEHRLDAEGADQLLLAGINDANFQELARIFGIRVVLRGDQIVFSGEMESVERAIPVGHHLIELARLRVPFDLSDIERFAEESGAQGEVGLVSPDQEMRIALPGTRKIISPKTDGQRRYLEAITSNDVVISIGPAGTGKTYLAVAKAVDALYKKRVKRIILARPAVEAGENLGFLPGRPPGEGGSLPSAPLRRPGRHDARGARQAGSGIPDHRDRPTGLYAGSDPLRRLRDPG